MHTAALTPLYDTSAQVPSKAMSLNADVIGKMHCQLVPEQATSAKVSRGSASCNAFMQGSAL